MGSESLFAEVAPYGFDAGATFSPCRQYRYQLWRSWGDGEKRVAFVGLNPSTADELADDPTIRKCRGFATRWGYETFDMLNLFAWRSTDPRGLLSCPDPIGAETDAFLRRSLTEASLVVFAWGAHNCISRLLEPRANAVWELARELAIHVRIFGRCINGQPKHPLMLGYATPLMIALQQAWGR